MKNAIPDNPNTKKGRRNARDGFQGKKSKLGRVSNAIKVCLKTKPNLRAQIEGGT
jgi:hypothetical protein